MRSASLDSMVRMRLSSVTTFWNGGGALKYRPGSLMTWRTSPSENTRA
ncbi:Uncharacterised protein [Bordetella pertussis]|nr:Uncharacterised protein [Bordetella pertussis]CPP16476.1 Uncharacterised protein [Bordetella pertussis]